MPTLQQINDQIAALEAQRATLLNGARKVYQIGTTGYSILLELVPDDKGALVPIVTLTKGSRTISGVLDLPAPVLQACLAARRKLDDWIAGTSQDITF